MIGILKASTPTMALVESKKKVSFGNSVEVLNVECLDDYTEEEIEELWYVEDDYCRIKDANKEIIQLIDTGKQEDEADRVCFRGLECKSLEGSMQRKELKTSAYFAIVYAQEHVRRMAQQEEKCDGWDFIRQAYEEFSYEAEIQAHELGLADAFFAWHSYKTHAYSSVDKSSNYSKQHPAPSPQTWRKMNMPSPQVGRKISLRQ
eukprot:scaffold2082_cov85-Cylindrotheca_fusiformis.AAC.5